MSLCGGEMVCPPPSIGWSALLLWTITLYGVLMILSLFAAIVNWREPTPVGARVLRILRACDLSAAGVAPLVIGLTFGAATGAAVMVAVMLALASLCRAAGARVRRTELPPARMVRTNRPERVHGRSRPRAPCATGGRSSS